jgi:imidazolonepropionase-like amidohydrolase
MDPSWAIVGATLVDGTGRPPIADSVVMVSGERIVRVGRTSDTPVPEGVRTVDGRGKTLLPGLIDAHTHVGAVAAATELPPHDREQFREAFLAWFGGHGITTVRCTGMNDTDETFKLMKVGQPQWPRYFGCGQTLDGAPGGPWPGLIVVADENDARRQAQRLLDRGVDFIKTYYHMTPEQERAVVETAHSGGVPVATHAGYRMTVEEAVRCGVDAVEHVRVGRELLPEENRADLAALATRRWDHMFDFRAWRYIDPSSDASTRLIELFLERGTFLTPTLVSMATYLRGDVPEVRNPKGMTELPEPIQARWRTADNTNGYTVDDFRLAKMEFERVMEWVGRAHREGVPIVAGTDTASEFVVPGHSLHDELELLVACGLSPLEAIVAATANAAELLRHKNEFGAVRQGLYADLLLLGADPLAAIRNSRSVEAVWKGGLALDTKAFAVK